MWTFLGERFAGWPDIVAVFGFNLLFHSTLLIGIGLAGMLFLKMRRKGSAAQSLLLRLCLLSVLVLPFALPVFSAIGISGVADARAVEEKPGCFRIRTVRSRCASDSPE